MESGKRGLARWRRYVTAAVGLAILGGLGAAVFRWGFVPVLSPGEGANLAAARVIPNWGRAGFDGASQLALMRPILWLSDHDANTPEEHTALGSIYFLRFMPDEAMAEFTPVLDGDDLYARFAWQRVLQMWYLAYDQPENVAESFAVYRAKFAPTELDISGLSGQVRNFANAYAAQDRHGEIADMIVEEVSRMPRSAPFRSFQLPVIYYDSFVAAGRSDEVRALLAGLSADLATTLHERLQNPPTLDDAMAMMATMSDWYWTWQNVLPHETLFQARNRQLQMLLRQIDDRLADA